MAATIRVGEQTATIQDWKWTSDDQVLADLLNSYREPAGPSGSDPDPGGNEAVRVAKLLGGEVVSRDPVDYDPEAIY